MSNWAVEASPAELLREQLAAMTPQQRHLQRLEWRWQRALPKWTRAATRIQALFRGYKCRSTAGVAKDLVAVARHTAQMSERALSAFQSGLHHDALEFLSACDRADLSPVACLIKAKSLYITHDFDSCICECESILDNPPHGTTAEVESQAIYLNASACAKLERWEDVIRLAEQLARHEVLGANARTLHRVASWKQDNLSYYEGVRVMEPRLGRGNDLNGCACAVYQNWDKALEYFNKAITEHPIDDQLHCLRARLKFCQRRYADARADYEHALKLRPSNGRAVEGITQLDYAPNKYPMVTAEDIDDR